MNQEEKRFKVKQIEKYDKLVSKTTKSTVALSCTLGTLTIILILAPYPASKIIIPCLMIPNLKSLCDVISEKTMYKGKIEEIKKELTRLENEQEDKKIEVNENNKDTEVTEIQSSSKKR